MLNTNSPIVQALMEKVPQGVGNMPTYQGNSPSITSVAVPQQPAAMYPSPKEMLMNGYNFAPAPSPYVGGRNPMFDGYSNPYMGYGTYMGNPAFYSQPQQYIPTDRYTRDYIEAARLSNITYEEQVKVQSKLNKLMSETASRYFGRSEEEISERVSLYDVKDRYALEQEERESYTPPIPKIDMCIKRGDKVIEKPDNLSQKEKKRLRDMYDYSSSHAYNCERRDEIQKKMMYQASINYYNTAPERDFDKCSLFEFLNGGGASELAHRFIDKEYERYVRSGRISEVYNRDAFRDQLYKSAGLQPPGAIRSGRYGVMPDGRLVSPYNNPAVAESFKYNPATGEYTVTAPNFISKRLEEAREAFKQSIDNSP